MTIKLFEVRDAGTFIPAIAIKCNPADESERYSLGRTGYGTLPENQASYVIFGRLDDLELTRDAYSWDNRTMHNAHVYVRDNFDTLESGEVIDVEYILGETDSPKVSERLQ